MDQKFIIERVRIDLVSSQRRPVNSFTDVSVITVTYGENVFGITGEFFAEIPKTGSKAERQCPGLSSYRVTDKITFS